MKDKQLNIVVSGTSGSGKTTFGLNLAQLLSVAGFDVSFDEDEVKHDVTFHKNNKENVKKLKESVKISITTMQEHR